MFIYLAVVAIVIAYIIVSYNGFISLKNRARNAWSDIDVQLKQRHDLVPNLVSTVQGYASHEKAVLEDVTRLRSQAMQMQSTQQRGNAEGELSNAIKSIFAISESYPDLRADKNFRDLQTQLTEIENNIQYARRYYNAVVRDFNTKCEMFPSNLIASFFNFSRLPYFQVDAMEREPVDMGM